jgi:hypothetical protein
LKIVGIASDVRATATYCMAGWWLRANAKQMPGGRQAGVDRGRAGVDLDPELLDHVGRAAPAGGRPVPVLDHVHPAGGGQDGGRGRDVERPADVPAGPARVEHDAVDPARDRQHLLAHHAGRPDQLLDARPLGRQPDEQPADLGVGRVAAHQVVERVPGLGPGQVLPAAEF